MLVQIYFCAVPELRVRGLQVEKKFLRTPLRIYFRTFIRRSDGTRINLGGPKSYQLLVRTSRNRKVNIPESETLAESAGNFWVEVDAGVELSE